MSNNNLTVSLLRGINIGGHRVIKMAELKEIYAGHDLQNISTYIVSGNVLCNFHHADSQESISDLEQLISNSIMKKYSFDVPVMIRTRKEFIDMYNNNPFLEGVPKSERGNLLHLTALSDHPNEELVDKLEKEREAYLPDEFRIVGRHIYLKLSNGAKTKLNNNFFEKNLKVFATQRNWRTITELVNMLK